MRILAILAALAAAGMGFAAHAAPDPVSDADAARQCGVTTGEYSRAPVAYACDALRLIGLASFNIERVDWPAIKAQALSVARRAASVEETHTALAAALEALGDGHSQFLRPEGARELEAPSRRTDRVTVDAGGVVTVDVQGFRGTNLDSMQTYIGGVRRDLADAESVPPCGYVVDLRRDFGGNIWPVLLALQPLLGTGKVGAFKDREGATYAWLLTEDRVLVGDKTAVALFQPLPRAEAAAGRPIALLLGPNTASSGEAAAIAFRQRPNTRSFGWHTHGATTANALLRLPDGAAMALATAAMTDRDGNAYPQVPADEETTAERTVRRWGSRSDITRAAALDWLSTNYACGRGSQAHSVR